MGRNKGRSFFADLRKIPDAHKIYRKLLDLPLLPADRIREGFLIIQSEIEEKGLEKWFKHMYAYFNSYWIPKVDYLKIICVEKSQI